MFLRLDVRHIYRHQSNIKFFFVFRGENIEYNQVAFVDRKAKWILQLESKEWVDFVSLNSAFPSFLENPSQSSRSLLILAKVFDNYKEINVHIWIKMETGNIQEWMLFDVFPDSPTVKKKKCLTTRWNESLWQHCGGRKSIYIYT
jgi:hypothetical protein